jgi:hypothetical protein
MGIRSSSSVPSGKDNVDTTLFRFFMVATAISCITQFVWLVPRCFQRIDVDGMAYTGIAHEIRDGRLFLSINAFRSPLISWIIALLAGPTTDYVRLGKLVTIATFFACIALIYIFGMRLWHSRAVAALACLLFTLGRGVIVCAIAFVTPDFLFSGLVLVYFIVLLTCLRGGSYRNWCMGRGSTCKISNFYYRHSIQRKFSCMDSSRPSKTNAGEVRAVS